MSYNNNNELRINANYIGYYKSADLNNLDMNENENLPEVIISHKVMRMSDFENLFYKRLIPKYNLEILPDNCKLVKSFENIKVYIIEEQPQIRTITSTFSSEALEEEIERFVEQKEFSDFFPKYLKKNLKTLKDGTYTFDKNRNVTIVKFNVAFPYIVFLAVVTEDRQGKYLYIGFRNRPIGGVGDTIYRAPLANLNNSGNLCLSDIARKKAFTDKEAVNNLIFSFWNAEFNQDWQTNRSDYFNKGNKVLSNYFSWECATKIDPNFIFQLPLIELNKVDDILQLTKNKHGDRRFNVYKELVETIYHMKPTGETVDQQVQSVDGESHSVFNPMYYDVCNDFKIHMDYEDNDKDQIPDQVLSVGDTFYLQSKKSYCFVKSFLGTAVENFHNNTMYLLVERNDGRVLKFKFTNKLRQYIGKQLFEIRKLEKGILKNGVEVSRGDIIIMDDKVLKIQHIRKNMFGISEAICLRKEGFYILENIEAQKWDGNNPFDYKGVNFDYNKTYIVKASYNSSTTTNYYYYYLVKLGEVDVIDVNGSDKLSIKLISQASIVKLKPFIFEIIDKLIFNRNLTAVEDCELIKKNYCVSGFKLIKKPEKALLYRSEYNLLFVDPTETDNYFDHILDDDDLKELIRSIYLESKETKKISIPGLTMDYTFEIGDTVVVADNVNSRWMINPSRIVGMKYIADDKTLFFKLQDQYNNTSLKPFIIGDQVQLGYIRKIELSLEGINNGDKIRAHVPGIPLFPKKDANEIVGFFTDGTDMPLVLCTNGCTLWLDDLLEKFDVIKPEARNYNRTNVASYQPDKIKIQPGDTIRTNYSDNLIILASGSSRSYSHKNLRYVQQHGVSNYTFDQRYSSYTSTNLMGFPTPRITKGSLGTMSNFGGIPNYYGGFKFIEDVSNNYTIDKRCERKS